MMKLKSIFFVLFSFILIEITLRLVGFEPGVILNQLKPIDEFVDERLFLSDSVYGAISFNPNSDYIRKDFKLNNQGYRSPVNFDLQTVDSLKSIGKKTVMMLGDSYTEGCCALPIDSSFVDIIYRNSEGYVPLNFGIGATDPVHYERTLMKFLPLLKPDLVVLNFYLGNDFQQFLPEISPGIPQVFAIHNYSWLNSTVPDDFRFLTNKSVFGSAKEAYDFYVNHFTLFGDNRNIIEKTIRHSVIFSRLYLSIERSYYKHKNKFPKRKDEEKYDVARIILHRMDSITSSFSIPMVISLIPSAAHDWDDAQVAELKSSVFSGFEVVSPSISNYAGSDFDGTTTGNHFNNSGHRKHAQHLRNVLDSIFSNQSNTSFR